MRKARSRKEQDWRLSVGLLTVAAAALAFAWHLFTHGSPGTGFEALALATFLLFVFFAFTKPTRCGVIGRSTRRPCILWGHGFWIGCHYHTWDKLPLRERPVEAYPSATSPRLRRQTPDRSVDKPLVIEISPPRSRFDVFMSLATLAATVVSAFAAVLSIH